MMIEKPQKQKGSHGEVISHPAFGQVTVSRVQAGQAKGFYGSTVGHHRFLEVTVRASSMERKGLHEYPIAGERLLSFSMTETQWGQFVSSPGQGSGTTVTLTARPASPDLIRVPGLPVETIRERQETAISEAVIETVQKAEDVEARLKELIATGKAGKRDLENLLQLMRLVSANLGRNLQHVQDLLERDGNYYRGCRKGS